MTYQGDPYSSGRLINAGILFLCFLFPPTLNAAVPVTITQSVLPDHVAAGDTVTVCVSASSQPVLPLVDVIWVIDVTGSMGDDIAQIRGKIFNFVDRLTAVGIDYRQGVVTFRDSPDVSFWGWAADDNEFKYWTLIMNASGGDDVPESGLEALVTGASAGWRTGASRVMILVTDAPLHATACNDGPLNLTTVGNALAASGIVVHAVSPNSVIPGCAAKSVPPLTGGLWLNIAGGDWTSILTTLGGEVASFANVVIQNVLPPVLEPVPGTTGSADYASHVLSWTYPSLAQGITVTNCYEAVVTTPFATPVTQQASFRAEAITEVFALPVTLYPRPTDTPTPTSTPTSTSTDSPTETPTSTGTPTTTSTSTWTPSFSPTVTATDSSTSTPTDSITPTSSATVTATFSATPTLTDTPTLSPSPSPPFTDTPTWSPTWTSTPSVPLPTPSFTSTPECGFHVWPIPYQPNRSVGGTLKVGCIPEDSRVFVFTVSGEKVRELPLSGRRAYWDGYNDRGDPASGGTYFILVKQGASILYRTKIILLQ